jgi:putative tryptophan/tyrosine transport system substrate-binding protein
LIVGFAAGGGYDIIARLIGQWLSDRFGQPLRTIEAFAGEPNGGLILPPTAFTVAHRALIISLAVRYRLPNIFALRYNVVDGGLASYGVDNIDLYGRAAEYVDRILKGEKHRP